MSDEHRPYRGMSLQELEHRIRHAPKPHGPFRIGEEYVEALRTELARRIWGVAESTAP